MWFVFALSSAVFLGIYDLFKKSSVVNNAVLPVLFFSTIASSILFVPILILSHQGVIAPGHLLFIPELSASEHGFIFLKSIIVLTSWICSYFALKHLPITIVAPIRATSPLWTLIGAIIIFGERLNYLQWIGVTITFLFFYRFSTAGKFDGISLRNNKWLWYAILGTLTGAASSLYDKFLIKEIDRVAVQAWFSFYQVAILIPLLAFLWWPKRKTLSKFEWRWTIPLIGIFLVVADFFYFYAIDIPDSLISLISALRRGSVIIAFVAGAIIFKEKNLKKKSVYLAGILTGIAFIIWGSA